MNKKKIIVSLVINALIILLGTIAITIQFFSKSDSNAVDAHGLDILRYFTNDGNIFSVLVAVLVLAINVRQLTNSQYKTPIWIYFAQLASTVSSLIIFFVVIFLLLPTMGLSMVTGYPMIILHIVNPWLITIGFIVFGQRKRKVKAFENIYGMLPVFVYGLVSLLLVLTRVWVGNEIPYPFLRVYENPLWMSILYIIGIFGFASGLSIGCNFINSKCFILLNGKKNEAA